MYKHDKTDPPPKGNLSRLLIRLGRGVALCLGVALVAVVAFGLGSYLEGRQVWAKGASDVVTLPPVRLVEKEIVPDPPVITHEQVRRELKKIGELATYSHEYEATVTRTSSPREFLNAQMPFTQNSLTITCEGVVKVGYNVEDIAFTVDQTNRVIAVTLPRARVLSHYVIWDTLSCQEENNILNPISADYVTECITALKAEEQKKAEEAGIYQKAEEHLKFLVESFLGAFPDYQVTFVAAAAL